MKILEFTPRKESCLQFLFSRSLKFSALLSGVTCIAYASAPSPKPVARTVVFRNMTPFQRGEAKGYIMKTSSQWINFDLQAHYPRMSELNSLILVSLMKLLKGAHLRFFFQMPWFLFINFSHFFYLLQKLNTTDRNQDQMCPECSLLGEHSLGRGVRLKSISKWNEDGPTCFDNDYRMVMNI